MIAFARRFFAHDKRRVATSVALALLLATFQGVSLLMLVPLLGQVGVPAGDAASPTGRISDFFFERVGLPQSLIALLAVYLIVLSARALLERYRTMLDVRLQLGFVRALRCELHETLLFAEWRFLAAARRSDLIQVMTSDVQRVGQAALLAMTFVTSVVILVVYVIVALAISPVATMIALAVATALAWTLRGAFAEARSGGKAVTSHSNRVYALVSEHLSGFAEIRAYGAEARSAHGFATATANLDDVRMRFAQYQTSTKFWMQVGGAVALCALLLIAVEGLHLPIAALLVLVFLFARIMPQAAQLQNTALQLSHALPAFHVVDDLLRTAQLQSEPSHDEPAPVLTHSVHFEEVSFAHRAQQTAVANLSFDIPARQTTAIIGPSGAGKSTTALLLAGMLIPDEGRILIDDAPLRPVARRTWRKRIGYVPQETFLIHDTLRANLLMAVPTAHEADLWDALKLADAADFVDALPDRLDTVVGDRGMQLSGGERQRIALARALLRRPEILILDEATSNVDVHTERRIFDALDRLHGELTIIVITHRLASIHRMDNVIRLENGSVKEETVSV